MTKFSSGGADAGKGSTNRRPKRQRVVGENCKHKQRNIEDQSTMEHTEEGEEIDSEQEGYSIDILSFMNGWNQSTSVFITNPSVLDCIICYEALTIPVFQCKNGHIVCSSCCDKLVDCPLCHELIDKRCKAIENVLESVQISCTNATYGCEETISYNMKKNHEKNCSFAPCNCPYSGCNFAELPKELAVHFSNEHGRSPITFELGCHFPVSLNINDEIVILKKQDDGNLFALYNDVCGNNRVYVSCIAPSSRNPGFSYSLSLSCGFEMISEVPNHQGYLSSTTEDAVLPVTYDEFDHGQLKLKLCIWKGDSLNLCIDLSAK